MNWYRIYSRAANDTILRLRNNKRCANKGGVIYKPSKDLLGTIAVKHWGWKSDTVDRWFSYKKVFEYSEFIISQLDPRVSSPHKSCQTVYSDDKSIWHWFFLMWSGIISFLSFIYHRRSIIVCLPREGRFSVCCLETW